MENKELFSFEEHLNVQFGKEGSRTRVKYEGEFNAFKLGVMIQDLRNSKGLTIEETAKQNNINKATLTKIENNPGIFKISTINRILRQAYNASLIIEISI